MEDNFVNSANELLKSYDKQCFIKDETTLEKSTLDMNDKRLIGFSDVILNHFDNEDISNAQITE